MTILKNSTIIIVAIIISNLFAYIYHIIAARILGPENYGVFGALISLLLIIALPAAAISNAITKFSSKFYQNKEYNKIGILKKQTEKKIFLFTIIIFIILVVFRKIISDYLKIESSSLIIIIGISIIFAFFLPVYKGILQGMKMFKIYSINMILESFFRLLVLIILLFFGFKVYGAVIAYGIGYLLAIIIIFPYFKNIKIQKNEKIDFKKIYNYMLLVFFINVIFQSIINLPIIFVKHYSSQEFAGFFVAALNLARISLAICAGIIIVMFPMISSSTNSLERIKILKKSLILTLLASIGFEIAVLMAGNIIIQLLYGKEFLDSLLILKYLGLFMIPLSVLQLYISYFLAKK
jgi:O-antigen/teichoic acid export membrane protein